MAKPRKYNIEWEDSVLEAKKNVQPTGYTVTVNSKRGDLCFGMDYVRDKGLQGKYLKFGIDRIKCALFWKPLQESQLKALKHYRKVTVTPGYGPHPYPKHQLIQIKKLLGELKLRADIGTYKKMQIEKYKPQGEMLEDEVDCVNFNDYASDFDQAADES